MATLPSGMHPVSGYPGRQGKTDHDLRRDRIVAIVVLMVLAALMGLMIWLASLNVVTPSDQYFDYWMMP